MGLSDKLLAAGGAIFLGVKIVSGYQQFQETQRRKSSTLRFDARLTREDFAGMAHSVAARTPRIASVSVVGMTVKLDVRSNSGLTTWKSEVDFNDYGYLTGKYWLTTENADSLVPDHFARALQDRVRDRLRSNDPEWR